MQGVWFGILDYFSGGLFVCKSLNINFPAKQHWKSPSQLVFIIDGLSDLRRILIELDIISVALPTLGCGSGRLDWNTVKPLIERELFDLIPVHEVPPDSLHIDFEVPTGLIKSPSPSVTITNLRVFMILQNMHLFRDTWKAVFLFR